MVESYVLGLADEAEREEFERLCGLYPQLVAARDAFERRLERHILANANQPPQHVRARLAPKIKAAALKQPPVMPMHLGNNHQAGRRRGLLYLSAAALAALLCCGYFLYHLQEQNNSLALANKQLQAKFNNSDSVLNRLVTEQTLAGNKSMAVVHLAGDAEPAQPQANIYWDSASAAVYLVVKNLQPLPPDKQYQLWARINGVPKSLGVFDAAGDKVILKMTNTKKADGFAITIEPKGGNVAPSGKVQATGKAKGL